MSDFSETDAPLIDAFVAALASVPDSAARVAARGATAGTHAQIDYVVEATIAGKPVVMLVEAKQTAFPRDVREAVWHLRAYQARTPAKGRGQVVAFIIAEAISPGAREILRSEGVGYFDKGGSLYVPTPGAFVYVDRPQPKNQARALGSIFHGRKAQVLLALFDRQGQWVSVKDIAEASGASSATTSQTLTDLERRDWVQSRGSGPAKERQLVDPAAMVDAWARYLSAQKPPRRRRYFIPSRGADPSRSLANACDAHDATYAITGEAAAQLYAPYLSNVSQVSCRMLSGPASTRALGALDARPVEEGWNLAVQETHAEGDFAQARVVDGVRLASPLQVYLDLQFGPGRAKEMADHLRRERLGV
ncbi:MAG: MarR family transcriptional regulator [Caulobacteraceae bacterium]